MLDASASDGLTIFWIPVRPSAYRQSPIARFQAAQSLDKPLSRLRGAARLDWKESDRFQQAMRRTRVCIYGGTYLQGMMVKFISELAYQVLDSMSAVIVCGGFKHSNEKPNAVSTDVAALRGAERYAKEHKVNKVNLKDCYEAWIPDPGLDSREDVKGVVRMSEADGITVRVMTGRHRSDDVSPWWATLTSW